MFDIDSSLILSIPAAARKQMCAAAGVPITPYTDTGDHFAAELPVFLPGFPSACKRLG